MAQTALKVEKNHLDTISAIESSVGNLKGFATLLFCMGDFIRHSALDYHSHCDVAALLEYLVEDLETKLKPITEPNSTDQ